MLQFQGRRRAKNYLAQREQWRLLSLFAMLAMVVVLMRFAGREQSWAWLFPAAPDAPPAAVDEPVDSLLPEESNTDVPDAVRMPAARLGEPVAPKNLLPGLALELYASVADDAELRGGDEHEAFFQTLGVLAQMDEQDPNVPRPLEVSYVQLQRQPRSYRGEWIRVQGVARAVFPVNVPENRHGVAQLRQVWVQPQGRPDDLLAVNVLQLPPGFPTGNSIEAKVTIDGVFFKRWAYEAQDAIRTTPLVLARSLTWTPPAAQAAAASEGFDPLRIALGVSAAIFVALLGFVFLRSGYHSKPATTPSAPSFQKLADLDSGGDVTRMLAELRARELAAEANKEDPTESPP